MKKNPWFKRKIYGWGWYPATWQGWIVTAVYISLVVFFSLTLDDSASTNDFSFTFLIPVMLLTIVFIRIAFRTGESPKWQWGEKKKK
ncbi:MAG TPA: hypothetical protein PLD54_01460 [Candidatus Levybacteria bacterium]|mgnify:CR=1 FL=1|nr:hypothetical protein [Candidatus Levybacteria bacterium]